jgi:mannose-6-phosphate isomerase-like protein (cupin superfamily)
MRPGRPHHPQDLEENVMNLRPYVLGPDEALPGPVRGVKASRASTGGSLTLIESTIDGCPPRHTHLYEDESFYLLEGTLSLECGGERFEAAAGSFVFLPRRVPHALQSVGGPARMLIIAAPGGLDEYFAGLHAATGPDERHRVRAAHGIVPS